MTAIAPSTLDAQEVPTPRVKQMKIAATKDPVNVAINAVPAVPTAVLILIALSASAIDLKTSAKA